MTCSLETQALYIHAITLLHNFIINHDKLPERYGQPANINANGELTAEELEALGIEPLPDNQGAGGFISVEYDASTDSDKKTSGDPSNSNRLTIIGCIHGHCHCRGSRS